MIHSIQTNSRIVSWVAVLCCLSLIISVIWSSDRGLEITDEAYYLLSAIHPEQILLYVSAQHWILAPLWSLSESLQGFRLTGAAILLGTSTVLSFGVIWMLEQMTDRKISFLETTGVVAAGAVGALLYLATIAPSPSYNLLASAGAYAGAGFTFLAIGRRNALPLSIFLCLLAGFALAICFVNKPTAGISSALVIWVMLLCLERGSRKWLLTFAGLAGATLTLTLLVIIQPSEVPVQESFLRGLELFRLVQTEPISSRLIRYAMTLLKLMGGAYVSFLPCVLAMIAFLFYPRRWLAVLTLCFLVINIIVEKNYSAGRLSQLRMMEAIFLLTLFALACGFQAWTSTSRIAVLFVGLIVLPFSVAIGTGNSLFTQIIVSLAPWAIAVAILAMISYGSKPKKLLQSGLACLLLTLVTTQVFTSYFRDPYHLLTPISQHTEAVDVGKLGTLKVDLATLDFLADMRRAKERCNIESGAAFLGLFNVPGLALVFEAIPPVSPWLNNAEQVKVVLQYWDPESADRVVIALTRKVYSGSKTLPDMLDPSKNGYIFCGASQIPFNQDKIEIWASAIKSNLTELDLSRINSSHSSTIVNSN